jgi:endoglucanase Acf2
MAKRLEVVLQDSDYREIQRMARSRQMSIAEWVCQALGVDPLRKPVGDASKKLEIIREAARHDYPVADVDRMLAEIESGYGMGRSGSVDIPVF